MSAYSLKTIPVEKLSKPPLFKLGSIDALKQTVRNQIATLTAVGKAVGADAVLVVDVNMFLQRRSLLVFNNRYLVNCGDKWSFGYHKREEAGLAADLYAVDDGSEIWSAALKTSVNVPTDVRMPWSMFGTWKYNVEMMAPDFDKTSKDLVSMLVYKLKLDASK